MKRSACLTALGAVAAAASVLFSEVPGQEAGPAKQLEVRFTQIETQEGDVYVALFDSEPAFKDRSQPVRSARLPFDPQLRGLRIWKLPSLPAGEYAIAAFHDQNGNGKLDTSFGVPTEPYGFSRQARGRFGPPKYEAAKFEYSGGSLLLEVELK